MKTRKLFALALAVLMLLSCAPVFVFETVLPTVQNVQITTGEGVIGVKWDVPQFPANKDILGYNILYSTNKTNWLLAGTVTGDSGARDLHEPEEGAFVHGTTYYICVQPYDWNHNEGLLSAPVTVKYTNPTGLKRAPRGMQGIKVTGVDRNGYPHWIKGTGKIFTVNANAKGNAKGMRVHIGISTFTNQFGSDSGYSPSVKKSVTL